MVICLFLVLGTNSNLGKRDSNFYKFVLLTVLANGIIDSIEITLGNFPTDIGYTGDSFAFAYTYSRLIFSVFGYISKPALAMMLLYSVLYSHNVRVKFVWIPLAITAIAYGINLIPGVGFYTISSDNHFTSYGDWGRYFTLLCYLVGGLYIIGLISYVLFSFRDRSRGESAALIFLALFSLAGFIISTLVDIYPILGVQTAAVSVLFFYLLIIVKYSKLDALTDLYNRQTFRQHTKNIEALTGVILIDMNNLKTFNDTYGHARGDEAIVTIASCIRNAQSKNVMCYRIGGDEFVVLCNNMSKEQVVAVVNSIDVSINKETEYDVAIGFKYRDNNEPLEVIMNDADKMMYEVKEAMKKDLARQLRKTNRRS